MVYTSPSAFQQPASVLCSRAGVWCDPLLLAVLFNTSHDLPATARRAVYWLYQFGHLIVKQIQAGNGVIEMNFGLFMQRGDVVMSIKTCHTKRCGLFTC